MEADQLLYQSQADPRPFMRARLRVLDPMETLEQTWQLRRGDADAGVRHGQLRVVVAPPERDVNAAFEGMLEGDGEEVEHDLLPHLSVDIDQFGQGLAIDR
jgi:hypothetical protein